MWRRIMLAAARISISLCLGLSAAASASQSSRQDETDPHRIGHISAGEVLVVGEVHGSKETPVAFVQLVDQMLTRAKVVSVGLEMPPSAGGAGCEVGNAALGSFWTRKSQDGRSSQAMREMVCQLKKRVAKGKVRLIYLDNDRRRISDEMVRRVTTEAGSKSNPTAILIGNFHARNTPNSFVGQLRGAGLRVTSVTTSSPDATTWNCTRDGCAARPMQMNFCADTAMGRFLLTKAPPKSQWDGCMVIPRLTSSPPALGLE